MKRDHQNLFSNFFIFCDTMSEFKRPFESARKKSAISSRFLRRNINFSEGQHISVPRENIDLTKIGLSSNEKIHFFCSIFWRMGQSIS